MESKRLLTAPLSPRTLIGKRGYQETNWSFGWSKSPTSSNGSPTIQRYHNESKFQLVDKYSAAEEAKKIQQRNKKTDLYNSKLPSYDPKNGHKTNIFFGEDKNDSGKKMERALSPRVPPGGRSQIIFG